MILFRDVRPAEIAKILSVCERAVDLSLYEPWDRSLLAVLNEVPLRRLSLGALSLLFPVLQLLTSPSHSCRGSPIYNVTLNSRAGLDSRSSHASCYHDPLGNARSSCSAPILSASESLQAVVFLLINKLFMNARFADQASICDDPRFVVLVVENDVDNWLIGARSGEDHWAIADAIVESRTTSPGCVLPQRLANPAIRDLRDCRLRRLTRRNDPNNRNSIRDAAKQKDIQPCPRHDLYYCARFPAIHRRRIIQPVQRLTNFTDHNRRGTRRKLTNGWTLSPTQEAYSTIIKYTE
ncbi:hypothetical protein C8R43DRAFT_1102694 [Mycena crocata]|nr:hypothetical protein C8R43DRAFT_1102694 [Mycena crocata]